MACNRCQVLLVSSDLSAGFSGREVTRLLLRWVASVLVLLVVMITLANHFRAPLERLGRAFVEHSGYVGMALGTFIADGFHFPIPPQFYMLLAVTSGVSQIGALAAITAGSLAGGFAGYKFSGKLSRIEFLAKRLERSRASAERLFERYGYLAAVLATLSPLPYSVLCYLSGLNGLPHRVFFVLSACRIPRLVFFYYVVRLGWFA
jgi:membrane protein YqaA with SNARE-associated domain